MRCLLSLVSLFFLTESAAFAEQRVEKIWAGGNHTCVLLQDRSLKCWGLNSYGQLGLEDRNTRGGSPETMGDALPPVQLGSVRKVTDVSIGFLHTCATFADQKAKCWGYNALRCLGQGEGPKAVGWGPGEMANALPFLKMHNERKIVAVAAGMHMTCVAADDGVVQCVGHERSNDPALSLTPLLGFPGEKIVQLSASRASNGAKEHSICARLSGGSVKCWGANSTGELGQGDRKQRFFSGESLDIRPVRFPAGSEITKLSSMGWGHCALSKQGRVYCWGWNGEGQLGILRQEPNWGIAPEHMGDGLPAIDLGKDAHVIDFAAGYNHVCALFKGGKVKCWGVGILGYGDFVTRGRDPKMMGDNLPFVNLGAGEVTSIATGSAHTCALFVNGKVKCWGDNSEGQLGLEDKNHRGLRPEEMGENLPFVKL